MAEALRARARDRLPLTWRQRLRRLNRFRWLAKYRALGEFGVSVRSQPRTAARFVFLDPELDNFTYELANEGELPDYVAEVIGGDPREAAAHMYELKTDQVIRSELERRTRLRPDVSRRLEYGRRLAWYAFARSIKPRVVVETGIQDGLASAVLLRALERNAEEGSPGHLISFDIMPGSGWLVGERFQPHWEVVIGSTFDTLPDALAGHEVGLFIHDSENSYECERFELEAALRHAAHRLVLVSNRAPIGGLRDIASERRLRYAEFAERPIHFYPGTAQAAALYERPQPGGTAVAMSTWTSPADSARS
jgi:Methyltransferase domain